MSKVDYYDESFKIEVHCFKENMEGKEKTFAWKLIQSRSNIFIAVRNNFNPNLHFCTFWIGFENSMHKKIVKVLEYEQRRMFKAFCVKSDIPVFN